MFLYQNAVYSLSISQPPFASHYKLSHTKNNYADKAITMVKKKNHTLDQQPPIWKQAALEKAPLRTQQADRTKANPRM